MAHLQSAAVKQITEIVNRYKGEGTPLMMILSDIQKEYGYIPLSCAYHSRKLCKTREQGLL